jgi:hypothetical protein
MCVIHQHDKASRIIFHFNKAHLTDPTIPMWVLKAKGQTHYVDHVDVSEGIGFRTKETPDSSHTKGSIQIKGCLTITQEGKNKIGKIH